MIERREPSMRALLLATLSAIATVSACVGPPSRPPITTPTSEGSPAAAARPTPQATPPSSVEPDQSASPSAAPPAAPNTNAPTAPSKPPAARSPPKAASSTPEGSSAPAKPPAGAATPSEPAAAPPLDLPALEERLRDTHAIGVFTKLSLKNQVNDLLDQFRGFHEGHVKVPLADLRQRYEQLLLQVITLLQDSDTPLANAIAASREAIWSVLADPKTFAKS
jgi:hypothetical protein